MSDSVYTALVSSALRLCRGHAVLDCAVNARCMALQTTAGVGLAFVPARAWERAASKGLHLSPGPLQGLLLRDIIPRYLDGDPLWTVIALAAMNSLFIGSGEKDTNAWFDGLAVRRVGMIGDLRPFANRAGLEGYEQCVFELLPVPGTHTPDKAPLLLPACDLVLITSAVFSNKSLHFYLPHIAASAHAFIFGHGTPLADTLLERFSLANNQVTDSESVLRSLRAGKGIRELKPFMRKVIRHRRPHVAMPSRTVAGGSKCAQHSAVSSGFLPIA